MEFVNEPYDDVALKIGKMMREEAGIKEIFANKLDCLSSACCSILVTENGNEIGFVNIVHECVNKFLFVDIGIKEQYRGYGYSKVIMSNIQELTESWDEFLIAETKVSNIAANKGLNEIGKLVDCYNDLNYYLINTIKYNELVSNEDLYNLLKNHIRSNKDYHTLISSMHSKEKVYTKK